MNNRLKSGGLAMALLAGMGINTGFGAVISVTSTNDNDAGSLRQAIARAASGDTLEFAVQGMITLTSGELVISKDLIINGPGASSLLINGNAQSRVFHIYTNTTASISGVTITNGLSPAGTNNVAESGRGGDGSPGGGLLNEGNLTLQSCEVIGNSAGKGGDTSQASSGVGGSGKGGSGGGIANLGTLVMAKTLVCSNSAGNGGIAAEPPTHMNNNTAYGGDGGGIYNTGTITLSNCLASNNICGAGLYTCSFGGSGGGLFNTGSARIVATTINQNSSGDSGLDAYYMLYMLKTVAGGDAGGVWNGGTMAFVDSTINNNHAGKGGDGSAWWDGVYYTFQQPGGNGGNGGGIYNKGSLYLTNSTLSQNSGGLGGNGFIDQPGGTGGNGGGLCNMGVVNIVNCTATANSAGLGAFGAPTVQSGIYGTGVGGAGGGIYTSTNQARILNTLIAGNLIATNGVGSDVYGTFISLGHNLVGISATNGFGASGDIVGSAASPIDAGVTSLADNGGPTMTCALLWGSPAFNSGDDAVLSAPWNLTTDQRGFTRKSGDHVDIGAFEFTYLGAPVHVEASLLASARTLQLDMTGTAGKYVDVMVSTNLTQWTYLTTVTNQTGRVSLTQPLDDNGPVRFFRAHEQP